VCSGRSRGRAEGGRIGDTLLLMEYPPVLTLGRNATRANILAPHAQRKSAGWVQQHRGHGDQRLELDKSGENQIR
jgi:lipoate-protein ligase B